MCRRDRCSDSARLQRHTGVLWRIRPFLIPASLSLNVSSCATTITTRPCSRPKGRRVGLWQTDGQLIRADRQISAV